MKFLHTGDWHIGKKLNGYDLLEEQSFAFQEVMKIAETEKVDGIIIAGDLYDRSVPSIEAVELFNHMLIEMNLKKGYPVFAISGNHDSATRLETGGPWYEALNFHLHTKLAQGLKPVEFGDSQLFLL
ncbi:metallophosphoesterase family protein, partial [Vagococcus salmoninarum]